ncbi:MAG: hypothetical protein EPN58_13855 [Rhodanobacter sp.]|nr:MAG: hypothetical protein EPN58_13855 [Rhodanobacter sp.]
MGNGEWGMGNGEWGMGKAWRNDGLRHESRMPDWCIAQAVHCACVIERGPNADHGRLARVGATSRWHAPPRRSAPSPTMTRATPQPDFRQTCCCSTRTRVGRDSYKNRQSRA